MSDASARGALAGGLWRIVLLGAVAAALPGCVDVPDYRFPEVGERDADRRPPPDMGDLLPDSAVERPPDAEPPDADTRCVRTDEICNGRDDDCDLTVDEGFDLRSGLDHCGGCGLACRPSNADGACVDGACVVAGCGEGFADLDGDPVNGCEYACPGDGGAERCNAIDDDCDGRTDEGIDDRVEDAFGVCFGAPIPCLAGGTSGEPDFTAVPGWQAEEDRCDGLDNDCDGATDEAQPDLGRPCTVGAGACARQGTRICAADGAAAVCDVEPAPAVADDRCDGIDADCDGAIDEGIAGCVQCDGRVDPPCNGCPDGTAVPVGWACVPAGQFEMGSPDAEVGHTDREGPIHPVRISRPFLIQSTEVTRRAWRQIFEDDPSLAGFEARRPVEQVNWYEALSYADALSEAEGRPVCHTLDGCSDAPAGTGRICLSVEFDGVECTGYRLPTEAEWAYAARAGTATRFWFGDAEAGLSMTDYFEGNSGAVTHEVGQLAPNAWGLYDVHGNVSEWVYDGYAAYEDVLEQDPIGADDAETRVRRGGSHRSLATECRAAFRAADPPNNRSARVGFRLVRTLP